MKTLELESFHGILTRSQIMRDFFSQLERVAPSDASLLVRGETGTGKELVARALHQTSRRSQMPFRAINCATLSAELLASELFGHVKGAFTGASSAREGLFKLADGGTLFLDELAEMPLDVQARVLRVLQEQSFVPMGGSQVTRVNVRVISATHQSLREAVEARTFREDLMYRVRVIPLFLPRLAQRQDDIEPLARHFLHALSKKHPERALSDISPRALHAMLAYDWPGNVRELQNVCEHAFWLRTGELIQLEDLTPELRGEHVEQVATAELTELDLERQRLLAAMKKTQGNRTQMAQVLGISRTTLWRKLREHGIA